MEDKKRLGWGEIHSFFVNKWGKWAIKEILFEEDRLFRSLKSPLQQLKYLQETLYEFSLEFNCCLPKEQQLEYIKNLEETLNKN